MASSNQFVDGEVNHAPDLVEDKNMENSKREFDVKLIECLHILWDSRLTSTSWQKKSLHYGWT